VDERERLCAGILSLQNANGSFRCLVQNDAVIEDSYKQNFYPGQAMMVLCREIAQQSMFKAMAMSAVEAAFSWYRTYFRLNPTTALVPWQSISWRMFCDLSWRERKSVGSDSCLYSDFVFELVDWLLKFQYDNDSESEEVVGGFSQYGEEPGYSSIVYTEAVVEALELASAIGLEERVRRYRESIKLALQFIFRLPISPATAFMYADPNSCVGGTTRSLQDLTIRCDFDQHTISTMLALVESPDAVR
jgi:hypothetical protein